MAQQQPASCTRSTFSIQQSLRLVYLSKLCNHLVLFAPRLVSSMLVPNFVQAPDRQAGNT
jgi:hypothetical protein